jgi:hypothetical protein
MPSNITTIIDSELQLCRKELRLLQTGVQPLTEIDKIKQRLRILISMFQVIYGRYVHNKNPQQFGCALLKTIFDEFITSIDNEKTHQENITDLHRHLDICQKTTVIVTSNDYSLTTLSTIIYLGVGETIQSMGTTNDGKEESLLARTVDSIQNRLEKLVKTDPGLSPECKAAIEEALGHFE